MPFSPTRLTRLVQIVFTEQRSFTVKDWDDLQKRFQSSQFDRRKGGVRNDLSILKPLSLYDPIVKLLGGDKARRVLIDKTVIEPGRRVFDIGSGRSAVIRANPR